MPTRSNYQSTIDLKWPIEGVARVLRYSLAIVLITLDESKFLDASRINGGLGLKELIPKVGA